MNFRFKLPSFPRSAPVPAAEASRANALRAESEALASTVANFLGKTGLFDREAYILNYPDCAKSGLDPLHHYVRLGIHSGRAFTSQETIAKLWRDVLRGEAYAKAVAGAAAPPPPVQSPERYRVGVYVSSQGSFFMEEIAALLAAGLEDAGAEAHVLDEKGAPRRDLTHHVVVAPHEFFALGNGRNWASGDFVSRATLFSTEQLQTQWFARSLPFLLRARLVADLNLQSAAILRRGGVNAAWVQPGYSDRFAPFKNPVDAATHPVFAGAPEAARRFGIGAPRFVDRPYDVAFLGSRSERREKLLARYAPDFAKLQTFVYCNDPAGPMRPEKNPMAAPEVTAAILGRTKVLINLHRDEYAYFEWWRIMQAAWLKTVVVTEPCFPHPVFKPGVHFFEEAPRHIADLAAWLATTPEGQAKAEAVRERAYADLLAHGSAKDAGRRLLAMLGEPR